MPYTSPKISTVAECDLLLASATKEMASLRFQLTLEERIKKNCSEPVAEIDTQLQSLDAELSAAQLIIDALPNGLTRDETLQRKTDLEHQKKLLQQHKENSALVALQEKELQIARIKYAQSEIENFITIISTGKSAL